MPRSVTDRGVTARARLRSLLAPFGSRLVQLVDVLTPSDRSVTFVSHPDLEDNIVALLRHEHAVGRKVTILAKDADRVRARAATLGIHADVVPRNTLSGVIAYARSRVCVTTHGVFGSRPRPRSKRHLGLWHGEYVKAVGRLANESTHYFDRMFVSGELSRIVRASETGLHPDRIRVTGVPRNSTLMAAPSPAASRMVVWAPTYRSSTIGQRRQDGDASIFQSFVEAALPRLERRLSELDAELWLRFHPSSPVSLEVGSDRIVIADDAWLEERGLTLYDALGRSMALITDYSSLWVDYLVLDRPVIGAVPDLDSYTQSRDLLLQPYDWWFPGATLRTVDDLVAAVGDVLCGNDASAQHRRLISSILLSPCPDPATDVWGHIQELS